ncbi:hypothetical protein K438DRAFT_1777282 [Mycena galopus ATCC 62051]|nr:hypothetical protein K438DRAFT_1777282 [Mycena galopus ATCC 62051]
MNLSANVRMRLLDTDGNRDRYAECKSPTCWSYDEPGLEFFPNGKVELGHFNAHSCSEVSNAQIACKEEALLLSSHRAEKNGLVMNGPEVQNELLDKLKQTLPCLKPLVESQLQLSVDGKFFRDGEDRSRATVRSIVHKSFSALAAVLLLVPQSLSGPDQICAQAASDTCSQMAWDSDYRVKLDRLDGINLTESKHRCDIGMDKF